MIEAGNILLRDARASFLKDLTLLKSTGNVEEAFSAWLLGSQVLHELDLATAVATAAQHSGAARTYRDVAVLGYGADTLGQDPAVISALNAGLQWLSGRPAFSAHTTPSFEVDGPALLGLALGIRAVESPLRDDVTAWMLEFLPKSARMQRVDGWDKCLISASAAVLGKLTLVPMPADLDIADLRIALRAKGICVASSSEEEDASAALAVIKGAEASAVDPVRSAARLAALEWILRCMPVIDLARPNTEQVLALLERMPAALKRWTWETSHRTGKKKGVPIRWTVENEYHVQNILWLLLSPVFPDLEDEENLPSLGHKHPRYDLGIPSLRLIIEVKYVRKGSQGDFAQVINEVAADASLYRTPNSGYDKLIAFVWDDSRITEQHSELIQGLKRVGGVVGAVVVARPGKMGKTQGNDENTVS